MSEDIYTNGTNGCVDFSDVGMGDIINIDNLSGDALDHAIFLNSQTRMMRQKAASNQRSQSSQARPQPHPQPQPTLYRYYADQKEHYYSRNGEWYSAFYLHTDSNCKFIKNGQNLAEPSRYDALKKARLTTKYIKFCPWCVVEEDEDKDYNKWIRDYFSKYPDYDEVPKLHAQHIMHQEKDLMKQGKTTSSVVKGIPSDALFYYYYLESHHVKERVLTTLSLQLEFTSEESNMGKYLELPIQIILYKNGLFGQKKIVDVSGTYAANIIHIGSKPKEHFLLPKIPLECRLRRGKYPAEVYVGGVLISKKNPRAYIR
ncbi:MAG TPA: hypothetical protein VJZ04_06735 [Lachnospiraceae bacterium]|nr:hypothetical protein [Lachnospiraceae bacterium]